VAQQALVLFALGNSQRGLGARVAGQGGLVLIVALDRFADDYRIP
jgi:hypothetical protein